MPIKPQDKPVNVAVDQATPQTTYVVVDVHGKIRARLPTQEAANAVAEFINTQDDSELMQEDMHDTGVASENTQQEKPMPRKKKKAVKKQAAKTVVKRKKKRKAK